MVACLLIFSTYITLGINLPLQYLLIGLLLFCGIVYLAVTVTVFPLLARFNNTIRGTLQNAIALSFINPFKTLLMAIISCLPLLIVFGGPDFFLRCSVLWFLIAFSASTQINSYILRGIFQKVNINSES